jgi:hypothetical protein
MLGDSLVQKALEMRHLAQCFPVETILKAIVWLEQRHRQEPHWKTAIVIALQYLVLATRRESQSGPDMAKEYFCQAVRWREEARRLFNEQKLLTAHRGQN